MATCAEVVWRAEREKSMAGVRCRRFDMSKQGCCFENAESNKHHKDSWKEQSKRLKNEQ
jgi:hypothetical protein